MPEFATQEDLEQWLRDKFEPLKLDPLSETAAECLGKF
jgi:hypothetical protein